MVIGKTRRSLLPQWIVDITILTAIRKHFPTGQVASYHFKPCHIHSRYEVHCSNSCSANTMAQAGKFNNKHSLKRCFIDVQNVLVVGCAVVQDNMKARWLTNIYQAKTVLYMLCSYRIKVIHWYIELQRNQNITTSIPSGNEKISASYCFDPEEVVFLKQVTIAGSSFMKFLTTINNLDFSFDWLRIRNFRVFKILQWFKCIVQCPYHCKHHDAETIVLYSKTNNTLYLESPYPCQCQYFFIKIKNVLA